MNADQAKKRLPQARHRQFRRSRSDRSNFGKPLDRVFVPPADGSFPCCRCLCGSIISTVVQIGSIVGQYEVEVWNVDM